MNQAMLYLDGAQLDGNIIKATFVLVSSKRRREPSQGIHRIKPEFEQAYYYSRFFVFISYHYLHPSSCFLNDIKQNTNQTDVEVFLLEELYEEQEGIV